VVQHDHGEPRDGIVVAALRLGEPIGAACPSKPNGLRGHLDRRGAWPPGHAIGTRV